MKEITFKFKCRDCRNIFEASIGTKCPKCSSLDVAVTVPFLERIFHNILFILLF